MCVCVSKHRFTTQKGDGRLFSFDLADKDGEIRATAFNEQADKFYDLLQVRQHIHIHADAHRYTDVPS